MSAINTGTAEGLLQLIRQFTQQGHITVGAGKALEIAVTKVLSTVDGDAWLSQNVRIINVDKYMIMFRNKTQGTYTADSLRAYASRVRRALAWYDNFLRDPTWTPPPGKARRVSKVANPGKTKTQTANAAVRQSPLKVPAWLASSPPRAAIRDDQPGSAATVELVSYVFPLRPNQLVTLHLPLQITAHEAQRLARFVDSLAIDEERI
ncbi:MAG TPA: hypothetical protein VLI05_01165 [Candidatus Saccharimonadia bacterium]|nr:hypothetical protein [Candidatus Saccharimonadia bacterium]